MAKYSEKFKMKVVSELELNSKSFLIFLSLILLSQTSHITLPIVQFVRLTLYYIFELKIYSSTSHVDTLDVLSFMKKTGSSEIETALHFGLKNPPLIAAWKKVFAEGGIEALNRLKGRPPMSDKAKNSKNKPIDEKELTYEQQLQKENELLRLEVEYLKKLRAFQMDPENYLEKHKQRYHTNSRKRSDLKMFYKSSVFLSLLIIIILK
nr:helix-turn-helix domain-containing protein [Paraliobacillus sediminis]